ncbi:hypothetical protein Hte_009884 [Hypoxylon texense]
MGPESQELPSIFTRYIRGVRHLKLPPSESETVIEREKRWLKSSECKLCESEGYLVPPPTAYEQIDQVIEDERLQVTSDYFQECKKDAEDARRLVKKNPPELEWTNFMKHILRTNKTEVSDYRWDEFQNWEKRMNARTTPKPDLTYGLTMGGRDDMRFPLEDMKGLLKRGIYSCISTGLQRHTPEKSRLRGHDRLCFPVIVCEMKGQDAPNSRIEECYCQAANASAAALTLQEKLLRETTYGDEARKHCAGVVFTGIGPRVKVWITYYDPASTSMERKMVCVWSTSLELTWGVLSLRRIAQNVQFVVTHILEPRLSEAVNQVALKSGPTIRPSLDTKNKPASDSRVARMRALSATPVPRRTRPRTSHGTPSDRSRDPLRSPAIATESKQNDEEQGAYEESNDDFASAVSRLSLEHSRKIEDKQLEDDQDWENHSEVGLEDYEEGNEEEDYEEENDEEEEEEEEEEGGFVVVERITGSTQLLWGLLGRLVKSYTKGK